MNMMIAILLYLGVATSPQEVNSEMISNNQSNIEYYSQDAGFLDYYQTNYKTYDDYGTSTNSAINCTSTGVVLTDWQEGD